MVKLKVIIRLRGAGVSLQKVRKALFVLEDLPDEPAPLAELEIIFDQSRVLVVRSDDSVLDLLAKQYVLRFSLADLVTELGDQLNLNLGVSDKSLVSGRVSQQ